MFIYDTLLIFAYFIQNFILERKSLKIISLLAVIQRKETNANLPLVFNVPIPASFCFFVLFSSHFKYLI